MKIKKIIPLLVEGGHLRGLLAGRGLVHGVGQQGEIGGEGRTKFLGDAQRVVRVEADLVGDSESPPPPASRFP